jgi:hypothetical protein
MSKENHNNADVLYEEELEEYLKRDLHRFGEYFLETVQPDVVNKKRVLTNYNIADILFKMSDTLNDINNSLMNISYFLERKETNG